MNEERKEPTAADAVQPDRRAFPRRTAIRIALAVVVSAATVLVFRTPIQEEEFMGDETDWISSGNYYTSLLLARDFKHEKWVANHLRLVGNFSPTVGWCQKYPRQELFAIFGSG